MSDSIAPLGGGLLLGAAAALLLLASGRIAGISGIFAGLFLGGKELPWRAAFVAGLLAGGAIMAQLKPELFVSTLDRSTTTLLVAGFLVGVGTRLGGGCTSGHGLCGVSRLSRRSIVATLVFMAVGMAAVFVVRQAS